MLTVHKRKVWERGSSLDLNALATVNRNEMSLGIEGIDDVKRKKREIINNNVKTKS